VKADLTAAELHYDIDETAWAAAERLDGKLLVVTSLNERSAHEIVERYRSLADIERGFRALKSTLDIAPAHHRLPDRISAHALLRLLPLGGYRVLRMRLKAKDALGSVVSSDCWRRWRRSNCIESTSMARPSRASPWIPHSGI